MLTACAANIERDSAPVEPIDVSSIPDAKPKAESRSRYGNPEYYDVMGKRYYVLNSSKGFAEKGIASWYGAKFHGRRTSSGESYDMYAMTAAHKNLAPAHLC
jgi:Lipoproteins